MREVRDRPPEPHHAEIGKRFRQVSAEINWENVRNSFLPLQDAYESLLWPAKLAGQEGVFSRDEKIDAVLGEARTQGGRIARAAFDLSRQLSLDSDRDRFHAQLKRQKDPFRMSPDEIQQVLGPQMPEAELGARLISAMDTFTRQLRDTIETRYQPILRLARRFKDALFSELKRLGVAGVCGECGQTFVMTSQRKRFCAPDSENRDCGARVRGRRSYKRRAKPAMTRSESARKAARARWALHRDSTRE
jgi:hypothetical protein